MFFYTFSLFQGLVQTQSITLHNSFSHKMTVESLKSQPPDEQFYFKPPKKSVSLEIEASKKLKVSYGPWFPFIMVPI